MDKRSFEDILEDYIKLVLLSGILAGITNFLIIIAKALYLKIFKNIVIDTYKLLNYSTGTATNIVFLYIFLGTVIVALLSLVVKLFARKLKYVKTVSILLYSLTPVIFFGWVNGLASLALLIWSIFLLYVGITTLNSKKK